MTTLQQLRSDKELVDLGRPGIGRVFSWHDDDTGEMTWVRSLEGTGADPAVYADLQEAAHLWIHADYEYDLWIHAGVEYASDIGADYVAMPFRIGDSTYRLAKRPDLWEQIPQYEKMLDAFSKWREFATTPRHRFFVELLTPHIVSGTLEMVFVQRDYRFWCIDLCPTLEQLERWKQLRTEE